MSRQADTRGAWIALLVANAAVIVWYWWQGSGSQFAAGGTSTLIALGKFAGLAAAYTVLLQFVFMGRLPWLERAFGLDKLSRIHHLSGKYSLLFLVLHPLLLTWGYSQLAGVSLRAQFQSFFFDYEHVWLAVIALFLFVAVVVTSLVIVRQRWRYESWYFVHLLVYLAVFLAFWHQLAVGSDLLQSRLFYSYWVGLYVVVFASHLVFRLGRPLYLFQRHKFTVSRIERETHQAVSIYITGRDLDRFAIEPGQFMIVRFLTKGFWWQAHPFSLSRLPDGKELRITVKELGDFTRQVAQIPVGTPMLIDGPYGVFTQWWSISPKVLFIAGGIGITPIRSLMEKMLKTGKNVVLLYGNRTQQDIVFRQEIDFLAEQFGARVVHIISDDEHFDGERGQIIQERLRRLVPDVAERDVYLCGPLPMMDAVLGMLRRLKVPRSRIHFERFSLQ